MRGQSLQIKLEQRSHAGGGISLIQEDWSAQKRKNTERADLVKAEAQVGELELINSQGMAPPYPRRDLKGLRILDNRNQSHQIPVLQFEQV